MRRTKFWTGIVATFALGLAAGLGCIEPHEPPDLAQDADPSSSARSRPLHSTGPADPALFELPELAPTPFQWRWKVVDTGQDLTYRGEGANRPPGQDAEYAGNPFDFTVSGDGLTVYDNNTRLTWTQAYMEDPDNAPEPFRFTYEDAQAYAAELNAQAYGGITTWRLPSIKELYSLIDFRGSSATLQPYIDESVFAFRWGDDNGNGRQDPGEDWRPIDSQYWSSTEYVGLTFVDNGTVFGVNFADGRIKGYVTDPGPDGSPPQPARSFVRYVSGSLYGVNRFVDNGDGTITDSASGLMWTKSEAGSFDWTEALEYAENLTFAGHSDWRLPNAKELQSIIDYSRAPEALDPAARGPAIDPIFNISVTLDSIIGGARYPWLWTSTTHLETLPPPYDHGAVYLAVGMAYGWDHRYGWIDVHGAGAQRSDPKYGNPTQFPPGCSGTPPCGSFGPQNDLISIHNFALCVRDAD